MKKNALLLAMVLSFGGISTVHAQACGTISTPTAPPQASPAPVDLCTGANGLGTLCGLFPSPENDVVYSFNIDATRTATNITISTSTPTFNVAAALIAAPCGPTACADVADNVGAGASETLNVATLANGSYFLAITTSPGTLPNCGTVSWVADGRLPVQLQEFSVN
jgi:hypothetical protein